jgi:16S rRNA (guanine527-N7)-methyltransferase
MADEFGARLAHRASQSGLALSRSQLAQLEAYVRLLERWNKRINLTALNLDPLSDHALDRLLLEPIVAAEYVTDSALIWIDLGSGGGSPAIPLKILRPQLHLTMIESVGKKAAFLREAIRTLALTDVDVENNRAEELAANPRRQHRAELVTARAVRGDAALWRAAQDLLSATGTFWVFRSATSAQSDTELFRLRATVVLPGEAVLDMLSPVI